MVADRVRSGVIIQAYEVLDGWKVDSFVNRQVIDIFIHAKKAELEVRGARWLVRFWKLRTSLGVCVLVLLHARHSFPLLASRSLPVAISQCQVPENDTSSAFFSAR
jgi:hypothetical protein